MRSDLHAQRRLAVGVLRQAIRDLDEGGPAVRADSWDWFNSPDEAHVLSFISICHLLDFRQAVVRWAVLFGTADERRAQARRLDAWLDSKRPWNSWSGRPDVKAA